MSKKHTSALGSPSDVFFASVFEIWGYGDSTTEEKKKRISLENKMKMIEEVESKRLSKIEVAAKFGIPLSILSTIVANSGKIQEKVESGVSLKRKKSALRHVRGG